MSNKLTLEEVALKTEEKWWNEHTKTEHFVRFEREIRFMMLNLSPNADTVEMHEYAHMILNLLVFALKDEFKEDNQTFLENNKFNFYSFINEYSSKFNKDVSYIKRFVEFYLFKRGIAKENS